MISAESKAKKAVLATYSSVMPEGALAPTPSRLTLIAALASREVLSMTPAGELWIAGEESYQGFGHTTGSLLVEQHRSLLPEHYRPVVFAPGENRLINTPYQVEAIAERCKQEGVDELTIVGWGFHELRIAKLLRAYDSSITSEYHRVEDVLMAMDQDALTGHLQAFGFEVGFETILKTGLQSYRRREWFTRQALRFGKKGQVLNWLSRRRGAGRCDDLAPNGKAMMGVSGKTLPAVGYVSDITDKTALVD